MAFPSLVASAFRDALTFWLPLACAGCGALDVALCERCRGALAPRVSWQRTETGLRVACGLPFDGVAARAIRALKEEGRTSLAHHLAPALAAALAATGPGEARVITIPASRAAFRRRGFRPVELLVRRARRHPERLLRLRRAPSDQRGLDRRARRLNVQDAFSAHSVDGRRVVVVDDVVTTGATLDAAVQALQNAGAVDVRAVALAYTPRRGTSVGESEVIAT